METRDAKFWIEKLTLEAHPEGGYFREVYRSSGVIPQACLPQAFSGDRSFATSIYYLLEGNKVSKFHRIASDEIWHFYAGNRLHVHQLRKNGKLKTYELSGDVEHGGALQVVIAAGDWFAAEVVGAEGYVLAGCSVAPGFEFEDFEIATRETLTRQYPQYTELIQRLT